MRKPKKTAPKRPRGRPRIGATPIKVRFPPDEIAAIDGWLSRWDVVGRTRAQAIRHLVAKGMQQ